MVEWTRRRLDDDDDDDDTEDCSASSLCECGMLGAGLSVITAVSDSW